MSKKTKKPTMTIVGEKKEKDEVSAEATEKVNDLKKDTQVISTDELDFLLPIMAGNPVSDNDLVKAQAFMNRDVNAGSVIQIAGYMNNLVKEATLEAVKTVLGTQRYQKFVLERLDKDGKAHEDALEDVKEDDEKRKKLAEELEKKLAEDEEK